MRRQMFAPGSAGALSKFDFSAFCGKPFLSDLSVELVSQAANTSLSMPCHAIILCRASKLLSECIEMDAAAAAEDGRDRPHHITIPVPSLEGGKLTLEAMYNPAGLCTQDVSPDCLVSILQIADQLQADTVMLAAAHALQYTIEPAQGSGSHRLASELQWPWSVVSQVLDLPQSLLQTHFCRPLLQRAHACLIASFADLEEAWTDEGLRAKFLALPSDAVEFLLSHHDLQVASENTVFVALTDYVERGRGRYAPPEQLAHFASLLRMQHISTSFFISHALSRPWLARAAGVMERKGRHRLFSNPLFQAGSPTHSSVASMSAANAEEGSIQEDRGSSSSNDSGRNSARALHPVVSAAMSRIDSRATDLSSEESFDAVAPMLPLPPNSALSASSNQEARAPTHATTTASTHRSSAHAPRLSQPPPNNNTLHIGYCGVSEATHAVGAGLSGPKDALFNCQASKASADRRSCSEASQQAVEEELRGSLRLCAQYTSLATGQAHAATTAGAIDDCGFLPSTAMHQPPREIPASSHSSLLDPNARKWDTRAAGTGMLQLEVPLHRLRSELEALGWSPPQAGRSPYLSRLNEMASGGGRGSATTAATAMASAGNPNSGGTSRDGRGGVGALDDNLGMSCTSSANLVASPRIVWAGYVWAMDVFVARDPDFVLGLSIHALYPAFGLPLPLDRTVGGDSGKSTTFGTPPLSAFGVRDGSKQKCAVAAQMLLSVYDVELGRWVALYPKAISTNTGIEQDGSASAQVDDRSTMTDPSSIPPHHPHYTVTYTDYYPVWTSLGLNQLVSDPASWQRAAYAPEGRILLRAELVHCA